MSLSDKAVALLKNNAEVVTEIAESYFSESNEVTWKSFIQKHTTPPVRFTTQDGVNYVDGFVGEIWVVWLDKFTHNAVTFFEYSLEKRRFDIMIRNRDGGYAIYFSTEQAAKDWVELNKPCLSVQDVVDWATTTQAYSSGFSKELLELIRKKEAK